MKVGYQPNAVLSSNTRWCHLATNWPSGTHTGLPHFTSQPKVELL